MLIDSHCHLHDKEFFGSEEAEEALKKARFNQVEKIICIGTDHLDSLAAKDFAASHTNVYWTYGVHPSEWRKEWQFDKSEKPIAIGEIGLDYHYGKKDRKEQIKLFNEMLQLAKENNLPVSFHIREAFDDFFGVIANFPGLQGVVHSFSDNKKSLKKILETTNYYIGINGMATYSTLPTPPIEKILLETDAPFLTPAPHRSGKNEPKNIPLIAKWLSEKLEISEEEVAKITTENTTALFHL